MLFRCLMESGKANLYTINHVTNGITKSTQAPASLLDAISCRPIMPDKRCDQTNA